MRKAERNLSYEFLTVPEINVAQTNVKNGVLRSEKLRS